MKVDGIAAKHIRANDEMTIHSHQLIRELIEYQARLKDDEIHKQLLKKLVLDYSSAERKLIDLNQLKNKFLGIAAHDLRNPLTSIRGFSEMLLEDGETLTEDQREMIGIIHEASENMLSLVNDLLDVSVIESGRLDLQIQKHPLKQLIEERCKILKVTADKKNIAIKAKLADTGESDFDRNRMAQVIDNIIGNAIKFSPFESTITVGLKKIARGLEMQISDQGPGMSGEDKSKLFGDFQRLSAQPTGGEKSTGLGLAIVKKVIQAHKGEIRVESTLGKGTTFIIIIPSEV